MKSEERSKFRESKEWKAFRNEMKKKWDGRDFISRYKIKISNLHHLDDDNYSDLVPRKFVFLGREMHKTVHFLYKYFRKDRSIISRLEYVLSEMLRFERKED